MPLPPSHVNEDVPGSLSSYLSTLHLKRWWRRMCSPVITSLPAFSKLPIFRRSVQKRSAQGYSGPDGSKPTRLAHSRHPASTSGSHVETRRDGDVASERLSLSSCFVFHHRRWVSCAYVWRCDARGRCADMRRALLKPNMLPAVLLRSETGQFAKSDTNRVRAFSAIYLIQPGS